MPNNPKHNIATDVVPAVMHDPSLLSRLRIRLGELGLDGMVVPHADRYQGEYLAPDSEYLLRLTGFAGSAGKAIVLADKAALFVDGRYVLQAQGEADAKQFEICHSATKGPAKWLGENITVGARIGFDPWLFTRAGIGPYKTVLEERDAALVWLDEDPIAALWPDRPAPPSSKVRTHDPALAGLSSAQKRKAVGEAIALAGCDAVVLSTGDSVSWLFNLRANDVPYTPFMLAYAIVDAAGAAKLFVEQARLNPDAMASLERDVEVLAPNGFDAALGALGKKGIKVRLAEDTAPMALLHRLEAAGGKVLGGVDPCQLPKAIKSAPEIDGMIAAHERDGVALTRFLAWLDGQPPGTVDELSATEQLESYRATGERFQGLSFPTISGAGPNGAIVHYRVTPKSSRKLENGELYLVDSGGQYLDGTTDVTRTVLIGTPKPSQLAEMKDRFTRVLKGHIGVASRVFPVGTAGQELDALARLALWEVGLDYDHGTGHGVGAYLSVHEGPQRIAKRGQPVALAPGMVVSVEPGYYKEGAYGIRIENLVRVVAAPSSPSANNEGRTLLAFEPLTLAPIDRRLIDASLMTAQEVAWVDTYHARVADTLASGAHLDDGERAWLAAATRALGTP